MKIGSTFLVIAVLTNLLACGKSEDSPAKKPKTQPKDAQLAPAALNQVASDVKTDESSSTKANSTELSAPLPIVSSETKVETPTPHEDEAEKKPSNDPCDLSDYAESEATQEPIVKSAAQIEVLSERENQVCGISEETAAQKAGDL